MKIVICCIVPKRGLGKAALVAALVSVAAYSSAGPVRAQDSSNMFSSVLGFVGLQSGKDQDSIDYQPRAPIVVPPRTDLPPPKEAVRDPAWPKDPDAADRRRAAMDSHRPAPRTKPNTQAGTSQPDQQGSSPLPSDGPADDCQGGVGICFNAPWKAVKSIMNGFQPESLQPGPEPQRKYLVEPPPGYREPAVVAKAGVAKPGIDTPKDRPNSADSGTNIRPQSPQATAGN